MNFRVILASISLLLLLSGCSQEGTLTPQKTKENVEVAKTEAPNVDANTNNNSSITPTDTLVAKLEGLSTLAGIGSTVDNLKEIHGEPKDTKPETHEILFNDDSSAVMEGEYAKSVYIAVTPDQSKAINVEDAKKMALALLPIDAKLSNTTEKDGHTVVEFSSELLVNSPFKTKDCYLYVFYDSIGVIAYGVSVGKWEGI